MVEGQGASQSPHGKAFYFIGAVFTLLGALLFGSGTLTNGASIGLRTGRAVVAAVYLLASVQAFERLFRPEHASRRAAALSESTRRTLRAFRTAVGALVYVGFIIGFILYFSNSQQVKDAGTDAMILAGVMVLLALFLADFCGERWPATKNPS